MGGKHKNTYRNKDFTDVEIEILSQNPNIKSVSAKQINYTDSFVSVKESTRSGSIIQVIK